MLTGHRLFPAGNVDQWRHFHLTQMPARLRTLKREIPGALEALVLSCLEKDPADRFNNWDEAVEQCAEWFHRLTGQPAVLDFSAYELTAHELLAASFSLGELHKYIEDVEICDRALALKPDFAEVWNNKGHSLAALGRREEALAHFTCGLS